MKKRDFIQLAACTFMPPLAWDIDRAISYAEKLWSRLGERGYGDTVKGEPKAGGVDYYRKLSPAMRTAFDRFWIAFNYKQGKQGAAMRWWQMGEMERETIEKIIAAAEQIARNRKNLPVGQTPIMAQGWLNEMRYLDGEVTPHEQQQGVQNQHQAEVAKLTGDLAHARRMAELCDSASREFWASEVERIRGKLRTLREEAHAGG